MRLLSLLLCLLAQGALAGRCRPLLVESLLRGHEAAPAEPAPPSDFLRSVCPGMKESCCTDRQMLRFVEGLQATSLGFQQLLDAATQFHQQVETRAGRRLIEQALRDPQLPAECAKFSTAGLDRRLTKAEMAAANRANKQLLGGFFCELCAADFDRFFGLSDFEPVMFYDTRSLEAMVEAAELFRPALQFLDAKHELGTWARCVRGEEVKLEPILSQFDTKIAETRRLLKSGKTVFDEKDLEAMTGLFNFLSLPNGMRLREAVDALHEIAGHVGAPAPLHAAGRFSQKIFEPNFSMQNPQPDFEPPHKLALRHHEESPSAFMRANEFQHSPLNGYPQFSPLNGYPDLQSHRQTLDRGDNAGYNRFDDYGHYQDPLAHQSVSLPPQTIPNPMLHTQDGFFPSMSPLNQNGPATEEQQADMWAHMPSPLNYEEIEIRFTVGGGLDLRRSPMNEKYFGFAAVLGVLFAALLLLF